MSSKKRKRPDEPILDTCEECGGSGEVQVTCVECLKGLTVLNAEPGESELCKSCAKKLRKSGDL